VLLPAELPQCPVSWLESPITEDKISGIEDKAEEVLQSDSDKRKNQS
jgi:hypothetical protein